MIARQFRPDPNDLTVPTIERLFYNQMRSLSVRNDTAKLDTFDIQFSDAWL